jgi:VIT1/CCC1 family predicted Fe2+/Mn2+ transporter
MTDADPTGDEHPRSPEIHHQHRDVSGGWLRPTVFGVTDGLVSNFALIAGVAGGDAAARTMVLAGLAGLVGGAFSMATGEYVSVRSQNESLDAEIEVERRELRVNPRAESEELAHVFEDRGVRPALAREIAEQISRNPEQALDVHAREELGIDPNDLPSPWTAAFSSLASFTVGAFVPLAPYIFGLDHIAISTVLALAALFTAGALTSRFTARPWWFSGGRQLLLGAAAAGITFGIGSAFGQTVG